MGSDPKHADPINSFALVNYISSPLGEFLTKLREELVPGCDVPAHLTILPPREIKVDPLVAGNSLRPRIESRPVFRIEIAGVEVFATTSVVYAEIGAGRVNLRAMHNELNTGLLSYGEPYPYHPHITLAQNIAPDIVPDVFEMARRRWKESSTQRDFYVERLHFVQNTTENRWLDLMSYDLNGAGMVAGQLRAGG